MNRQTNSPVAGSAASSSGPTTWLMAAYGLAIASWMFDFKADKSGAAAGVQLYFLGLFLLFSFVFVLVDRGARYAAAGLTQFLVAGGLFLLVGISTALFNAQLVGSIASMTVPTVMYLLATYMTCRLVQTQDARKIRRLTAVLCVLFVVSGVAIQRIVGGPIDFSSTRYEILGGATIPALGYVECMILFGLSIIEAGALAGVSVLLLLSVTRTYMLGALVQFSPLLLGWRQLLLPRLPLVAGVAGLALAGLVMFGGGEIDRWSKRLFEQQTASGEDVTYYTRQSEWDFMIGAFTHGGRSILFGNGIAARTVWYNPREVGGGVAAGSIGFGHGEHISLLFIGGVVGGGLLLVTQFLQGIQSFLLLARLAVRRERATDLMFLAAWGATIILGALAANFFSSILGNRSWALWYGIGTGLFIGARARYRHMATVIAPPVPASSAPAPEQRATRGQPRVPPAVARRRRALALTSSA